MLRTKLTDTVSLVKSDEQRYDNIKALVQPEMIFIADASLPIEEGDRITRELPNGLVESYLVLDRGFYSAMPRMDAHYQVKVRKETRLAQRRADPSIGTVVLGDQINLANLQQTSVIIRSRLENVAHSIGSSAAVSQSTGEELERLLSRLNEALQEVPADRSEEAIKVSKRVETLIEDATSETPDKERVEITGESLILAAKNLANVIPIVLTIATQIVDTVLAALA
jgi:hypothetical protein